jgi:hypothetical protein
MSREHGGFINSSADAADIPFIRDPRETPLKYPPVDHESERRASECDRYAAARGIQLVREDALRDAREAAFRKAIRGLQLTPEQITVRIAELFPLPELPPPAETEEEIVSASTAEDD